MRPGNGARNNDGRDAAGSHGDANVAVSDPNIIP